MNLNGAYLPMENKANKSKLFDIRRLPQDIGRIVCIPCLAIFRIKKYNTDGTKYNSILRGGNLIAANHIDFSDPFIVGTAFWYRRVFFLASEEIMDVKGRNILLRGIGCIRIDRNISDIEGVRRAVDILKSGRVLTVFPQGGIKAEGHIDSIKSGTILMALKSGVPIIPMYSEKRRHWYEPRRVVIGEKIDCREHCSGKFPSMADIEKISQLLLCSMEECRKTYDRLTKGDK